MSEINGREPQLGGESEVNGREPMLGGARREYTFIPRYVWERAIVKDQEQLITERFTGLYWGPEGASGWSNGICIWTIPYGD